MFAAPTLSDLFDRDLLDRMVDEKFVARKESGDGLVLFDYSPRCQYEREWNDVTTQCRGLVATMDGEQVLARPFRKFFNLGELAELPAEPFELSDKMDGSLAILFNDPVNDRYRICTRGSFESEQAVAASRILSDKYPGFVLPAGETWLFEFIAPWNRIVVDYGDTEDLVLLTTVETATGAEHLPSSWGWEGPVVKRYDWDEDLQVLLDKMVREDTSEAEGYVIRFASGLRAKVKYDEYVRLHRILTQCSSKTIWEMLSDGRPLDEVLERVPDEFFSWVRSTADGLTAARNAIEDACLADYQTLPPSTDYPDPRAWRKAFAEVAKTKQYPGVLFRMLDGKPYNEAIWKMVKPTYEKPFKEVTEL